MNKYNLKILISLIVIFSFCIFVAAILTQNNFINDDPRVNQPSIDVFKLGLNDNPQESENRSTYQKFQEFWTEVFSEDAINWSYLDWRNYIILQIYGTTEDNLNSTIKSDPLFENNIDIFTIYVMGKYNGLLSDEDITNLKSQLMHNSVHIGDISFLNHDDTQFKLFINIEVESSPSMWYVADHIEIYLKSENSSGKWYDELGTHYVKVFDRSSLELTDPIPTDGNYKNHIVGPININTNTIEENVSLLAKVDYFTNFLMDEYVEKLELFNIVDDDESPPEISYTYTGDYTDGNPGELITSALDASGLSVDPSGTYSIPNSLGAYKFTFNATDADNDRPGDMLNSTITVWINITDDDVSYPDLSFVYTGDYTDGNPGELIVNASDLSGLSLDPSGIYQVPSEIGNYKFIFTACDADTDRLGDMLNTTITVWITIIDDDDEGPLINMVKIRNNRVYDYYEFLVIDILAEDKSGISELYLEFNGTKFYDDNGDNQILIENPRIPGMLYFFSIVAIDADNDREGDQKITQMVSSFEVFDDDSTPPEIFLYYDDINYQITILDNDGIFDSKATGKIFLIDEEGVILQSGVISQEDFNYTIPIPLKPGNYNLEVYTTNNDLEWNGDEEINYEVFSVIVDLEGCFKRVDTLLKDLIDYVDENLYLIIADNIRFKLCLAREYLMDAYILVNKEALNHGLFNELVIQGIIEFVEFETDFYSKFDLITEEIRNEIILYLHQIRNFVILLIGSSVDYAKGINCGFDIASIEVELLNLADIIKEELGDYSTQYLEKLVKLSALQLELAVIKLSRGIDPDSSLSVAQKFIDRAMEEVNNLVESIKIYEGIASYLLERLNNCYINIEEILRR